MILEIIMIVIGFIVLIKGADFLVDGACFLAKKFHIPEVVIALTVVSMGTSMPELVVSLKSAINGYSDMAIGNVVGSNIVNLFVIIGLCAIIKPLTIKRKTKLFEIPLNLFSIIMLYIVGNTFLGDLVITRIEGLILLLCSVLFILYNIYITKKSMDKKIFQKTEHSISIYKTLFLIITGIILLKFGGDIVVDNSVKIAKTLGITEKVISITIIAISSSLPELITSVTAAIKGNDDMAIGNVLGSQIFNIFLILGICALVTPVNYLISFNRELVLLTIGALLLLLYPYVGFDKNKISRFEGLVFLLIYLSYIIPIIM